MLQRLIYKRGRWGRSIVIIFMAFAVAVTSILPPTQVEAAPPVSYAWSGNSITMKAKQGEKGSGSFTLYTGVGAPDRRNFFRGLYKSTNPTWLGLSEEDCFSDIWLQLTGPNSGTIIAPLRHFGDGGSGIPICKGMPSVGTRITIAGTQPRTEETEAEKTVRIYANSPKSFETGQPSVNIRVRDKDGNIIFTSKQQKFRDVNGYASYGPAAVVLGEGRYTYECYGAVEFSCPPQTHQKQKFYAQTIFLGETGADRETEFLLVINRLVYKKSPNPPVSLLNAEGKKIDTIPTQPTGLDLNSGEPNQIPPEAQFRPGLSIIYARGKKQINAGSYTACVEGRIYCQIFQKNAGESKKVIILIGFEGLPKDDIVCVGGLLGIFVCPLAELTKNISQTVAKVVEGLLYVQPIGLDTEGPIYTIWEPVRDIANIVFIILFIFMIYSIATGLGMSNYGVKQMLPRLMVMAILVNISYYVCAFAVDAANLVGAGVKGLMDGAIQSLPAVDLGKEEWDGSYGGFAIAIFSAIFVLALAGPLWSILAAVFAVIMLAVLTGFVVLVVRQVLIVLLIILSPLAFSAGLLPNTEHWFKKWRKTFLTLLLSYPIMMFVFYGSALVAAVVGITMMPK